MPLFYLVFILGCTFAFSLVHKSLSNISLHYTVGPMKGSTKKTFASSLLKHFPRGRMSCVTSHQPIALCWRSWGFPVLTLAEGELLMMELSTPMAWTAMASELLLKT